MLNDRRNIGGVKLDGAFFGPILNHGLNRPLLVFGAEGRNLAADASWETVWAQLRGWKLGLVLNGTQHATFTDLPFLAKVFGLDKVFPPETALLLGTLDGARALDIVSKHFVAFLTLCIMALDHLCSEDRRKHIQKFLS
jgi:hypothetical protein